MRAGTCELVVPQVPPSLNRTASGRGGSHWPYTRAKREWEDLLWPRLVQCRLPARLERVSVTAYLTFSTRRRRDEGNFRWLLEKALGDALVKRMYLPDDTPEHFSFGAAYIVPEPGVPQTRLLLEWVERG